MTYKTNKKVVGRPPNFTQKQIDELIKKYEIYINTHDIPIIAEFCYQNNITKDDIHNNIEFHTLNKKALAKKESALESKSLKKEVDTTMAIFSLKQIGWRDKQEIEHSGDIKVEIEVIK